ncbi:MAG: sigma-70 family RNA polymerase sigma factor [Oscillospiraceae bacterium]|nr:sigma-70 family RNA polymerase sigma factor [Oscillospiraceae bacterium]
MLSFQLILQTPEEKAFMESVLDEYGPLMLSTARRYVDKDEAAEDVVQESFVRLIRHVRKIMGLPRCNLAGYVVNTVKNTAKNQLRAEQVRQKHADERAPEDVSDMYEMEQSAEWVLVQGEERKNFYAVWETLPEADRTILEKKYILGETNEEIAQELGCRPDSVRMKLSRARHRAMKAYGEWVRE